MGFFVMTAIFMIAAAVGVLYGLGRRALARESGSSGRAGVGRLIVLGSIGGFAVLFVGLVLTRSVHFVDAGHVGIVKQFGDITGQENPGAVWIAPWQDLDEVNVQIQSDTFVMDERKQAGTGAAVSRDSQPIFAVVTLNYRVDPGNIIDLYKQTGGHYKERLIDPRVPQTFKSVTARYKAIEVAANRERIRRETQQSLDRQLAQDSIHVTDFLVENIDFTDEFAHAVEETQIAEQRVKQEQARVQIEKKKAQQQIERARGKAQGNLIESRAQATANRLLAGSLSDRVVHFKAIEKLGPNVTTILLPSGSNFLLPSSVFNRAADGTDRPGARTNGR